MIPGITNLVDEPVASLPVALRSSTPNQFAALLTNPDAELLILLIATPYDASLSRNISALPAMVAVLPVAADKQLAITGGETSIYLSDKGFATIASDSIPHQYFDGRLAPALSRSISLFENSEPNGSGSSSTGDIVINNDDGAMDALINYAWDGRDLKLLAGQPGLALEQFGTVLKGTVSDINADEQRIMLRVKDPTAFLSLNLERSKYGGTGGADGDSDLEGVAKPYAAGRVRNITPYLVSSADLLFQVNDGQVNAIDGVRDKGVAITLVGDWPSSAALLAATTGVFGSGADIEAGEYGTCLAEGLFRLAGQPDGIVTADVEGDAAPDYASTTALIVKRIVTTRLGAFALQANQLDIGSINALSTAQPATVGVYVDQDISVAEVISGLMAGIGGYWYFNRRGEFTLGRLTLPSSSDIEIDQTDLHTLYRMDLPLPVWRRRVAWKKSWTVQDADNLALAVSDADRQLYGNEYRYSVSEDSSTRGKHRLAREIVTPGYFDLEADADTEAERLRLLHSVDRHRYRVQIKRKLFRIEPNIVITLTYPRYNLNNGKDFVVASIEEESDSGFTTLEVWG